MSKKSKKAQSTQRHNQQQRKAVIKQKLEDEQLVVTEQSAEVAHGGEMNSNEGAQNAENVVAKGKKGRGKADVEKQGGAEPVVANIGGKKDASANSAKSKFKLHSQATNGEASVAGSENACDNSVAEQDAATDNAVVTDNGNGTATEQGAALSQQEVSDIVNELAATPKKKRIWEVDFLRGFMILFVVWDHFMWDVKDMGPYQSGLFTWLLELSTRYYQGPLRRATHDAFVTLFVFTSGVSCSFSRNNGRRAIKMMSFALLFTAVTYAISAIINQRITIYFNVIHVIALSVALWTVIEWSWKKCIKTWQKNVFGAVMTVVTVAALVVGATANMPNGAWEGNCPAFYFLATHKTSNVFSSGGDFLPFLPDFGWFLVGAFLGKLLYKERKSLFPSVNPKWVSPITFCGRYSIWIYFGSQVVMYGLIYLLSKVAHIL